MNRTSREQLADRVRQGPPGAPQSKAEQSLNRLDDKLQDASDNPYTSLARDAMGTGFSAIKDQVSNFAENCQALLPVLDTLSKAHPVISVAVSVVKVGVELELTRRENDGRVLALYSTMLDMMDTLRALDMVATPSTGATDFQGVEARLEKRFDGPDGIVTTVNACLRTCDSYYKCRLPVKILTSGKWKQKFAAIAEQFEKHRSGLQMDLQVHAAQTLTKISSRMDMVFDRLCAPDEQDLVTFVHKHGGADSVTKDEDLMARLLEMCNTKAEAKGSSGITLLELQKQISKDVERIISEDFQAFESKFMMMKERIEEKVGLVVHRETDRVIKALEAGQAGPHERIVDKDVYQVWTENRWRGSVKANRLVLALHDHFSQLVQSDPFHVLRSPQSVSSPITSPGISTPDRSAFGSAGHDAWALQYINVFRVQQLVEAIDDDVSSFITIDEVNSFTSARPIDWSLPHWIAYSTIGIELAVNWYYRRILRLLHQIDLDRLKILPANRTAIDSFMDSPGLRFVEHFLSGLKDPGILDDIDWDYDILFKRFRGYIVDQENAMRSTLQLASYNIGDESALRLLTQGRQPEKYIFPLLCLLVQHATVIVRSAWDTVLNEHELMVIDTALCVVLQAVQYRINMLEATYKLQNLDHANQIRRFFYGVYSNVKSPSTIGDFWYRDATDLYFKEDADYYKTKALSFPVTLFYGPSDEDIDFFLSDNGSAGLMSPTARTSNRKAESGRRVPSLLGRWVGGYAYGFLSDTDPDMSVTMDVDFQGSTGSFTAHGRDKIGDFTFRGRLKGARITMQKSYASHNINYEGSLSDSEDQINGRWGGAGWGGRFWMKREVERPSSPNAQRKPPKPAAAAPEGLSLVGHWWGSYTYTADSRNDGPVSFDIVQHQREGPFTGGGLDAIGPFTISGRINRGRQIALRKAYDSHCWDYAGTVNKDNDEITGTWGDSSFGGTFYLRRRPADYFLFRPPELESAEGATRARLLWRWALDTVTHRWRKKHLQTAYIHLRREYRDRYSELVLRKDAVGRLYGEAAGTWAKIVKMVNADELRYWRLRALFVARRQICHREHNCDGCGTTPILGARLVCVECSLDSPGSEAAFATVSFCWKCFSQGKDKLFAGQRKHNANHHLLLLRTVVPGRKLFAVDRLARRAIEYAGASADHESLTKSRDAAHAIVRAAPQHGDKVEDSRSLALRKLSTQATPACACCKKQTARPFWLCLTCSTSVTIICCRCNAKVEAQRPWLSEHQPRTYRDPEGLHPWAHTLLLLPSPATLSDTLSGMEGRLASLESRLTEHLGSAAGTYETLIDMVHAQTAETAQIKMQLAAANQRMTRIEELLMRIVGLGISPQILASER